MQSQNSPICHKDYFEIKYHPGEILKTDQKLPLFYEKFTFTKEIFICEGASLSSVPGKLNH